MPKTKTALPRRPNNRPTSYDVAELAGVSQSAVSRCFREGSSISPKTKAKVLKAARSLGYQPNAMASGLMTNRTGLVAVLISNLTNLYYPEVLSEITRRLSDRGYRVLLFALEGESEVDAVLEQVWRYRVDGAVVAARLSPGQLSDFETREVPVVLYNRVGDAKPVSSVSCDSHAGERELVDRLVAAGHQKFGIIAGPDDSYVGQIRVESARERLGTHGFDALVYRGGFDYDSGRKGFSELFSESRKSLDALICANDLMAIGAMDGARGEGLSIPEEISIVGFDGVAPAHWESYKLTTVRQPVRRMTDAAVSMIVERIERPDLPPEVRTFAGGLLEGRSARLGDPL
ncbi:MAG: LacI family DNA-binding transcriptional regulator [Pseudomonadota bacterium]